MLLEREPQASRTYPQIWRLLVVWPARAHFLSWLKADKSGDWINNINGCYWPAHYSCSIKVQIV
jgi:hypothetical protein